MSAWRQLEAGVWVCPDSCHVYAVAGADGAWLIINAGGGAAAARLPELGAVRATTVLLTHHFRDHTAGAPAWQARGARLAAPWHDREHLAGEQRALRTKPTLFLYDLAWDHFAPVTPLEVDRWMLDYETLELGGLRVEVVPTPAFTMGAVTYVVTLPGGRRLAFVGELMCAPGRVGRIAPLQYNYNDLTGLENVRLSWQRVMATQPDLVLPSMGEPFSDLALAMTRWRENAVRFESVHPGITARMDAPAAVELEPVLPRLWRAVGATAETHFVLGRSGNALALDFGYDARAVRFPARMDAWTRRPLLHSVDQLRSRLGARISTVIPTHYHDDHIAGIPLLQRLGATEVWAGGNFADLLERPADFDRPCLWPEPIRVDRRLPLGQPVQWEDVTLTLWPMSGHTEFSTLICLELDGVRVAHTGDQIFFLNPQTGQLTPPESGGVFTNHVYRNGLALGGYVDCVQRLREFAPAWVLSGHHRPYQPEPGLWDRLAAAAEDFDAAHRAIMPLGADDAHFGADSVAGKIVPHQLTLRGRGGSIKAGGWVRNPLGAPARVQLRFAAPAGVRIEPLQLELPAHGRGEFSTRVEAGPACRPGRYLVGVELAANGRTFGQVAECWLRVEE